MVWLKIVVICEWMKCGDKSALLYIFEGIGRFAASTGHRALMF